MNNDEFRRTFLRTKNTNHQFYSKKKVNGPVKLPSVKSISNQSAYNIGEIIGEGGFAKVKYCTRKKDGENFVIKIFDKFRVNTEQKKKSVNRQIQIMKCIKHPNIIKIIDYFQNNQTINIVMQKFSPISLTNFIKNKRPIQNQILRTIVIQIAQAVCYLHKMKIAHRDLKPDNILINQKYQIKIIDLGLSLMGDNIQTKIAGTQFYMSPQLLKGKNYDPYKSDIWAFGILIYWLVLGYFPQNNDSPKKKRISSNEMFHLHFPKDMHPGIEYLITKMLKQDPLQRINAEQLLTDTWLKPVNFKDQIFKLMKNIGK